MIGRIGRLTLVAGGLSLATFLLIVSFAIALPTAGAEPVAQPKTPHSTEGREDCLLCHGANGPKPVPATHAGRQSSTCLACHQVQAPAPGATPPSTRPAAESTSPGASPSGESLPAVTDDSTCLSCHNNPRLQIDLGGGQKLSLHVDPAAYGASVHANKLSCRSCHTDKAGYAHPKTQETEVKAYAVAMSSACGSCHQSVADLYRGSAHGAAVQAGNTKAATCTDCHTAHAVQRAPAQAERPALCAQCHVAVTETYQNSVHGKLVAAGRADAATCTDCHTNSGSTHGIEPGDSPDAGLAAKNVAETCGKCHTKAKETYESTFHGRAVRLGNAGNAPTCVDCHGAYGVQRVHGAEAPVTKAKLAETCAKCHAGANENFLSGWMGHEEASPGWFPMVFITERFLFYLTTSVVAFGIVHVELDVLRWFVSDRRKKKSQRQDEQKDEEVQR